MLSQFFKLIKWQDSSRTFQINGGAHLKLILACFSRPRGRTRTKRKELLDEVQTEVKKRSKKNDKLKGKNTQKNTKTLNEYIKGSAFVGVNASKAKSAALASIANTSDDSAGDNGKNNSAGDAVANPEAKPKSQKNAKASKAKSAALASNAKAKTSASNAKSSDDNGGKKDAVAKPTSSDDSAGDNGKNNSAGDAVAKPKAQTTRRTMPERGAKQKNKKRNIYDLQVPIERMYELWPGITVTAKTLISKGNLVYEKDARCKAGAKRDCPANPGIGKQIGVVMNAETKKNRKRGLECNFGEGPEFISRKDIEIMPIYKKAFKADARGTPYEITLKRLTWQPEIRKNDFQVADQLVITCNV